VPKHTNVRYSATTRISHLLVSLAWLTLLSHFALSLRSLIFVRLPLPQSLIPNRLGSGRCLLVTAVARYRQYPIPLHGAADTEQNPTLPIPTALCRLLVVAVGCWISTKCQEVVGLGFYNNDQQSVSLTISTRSLRQSTHRLAVSPTNRTYKP
jgi:hypothetical protein